MVTPVLSQPVARPALVGGGVYELTHLNMSPDRATLPGARVPAPYNVHMFWAEKGQQPRPCRKGLGKVLPCCSRTSPQTLSPQDQKAVPQSGWFIEILVKK